MVCLVPLWVCRSGQQDKPAPAALFSPHRPDQPASSRTSRIGTLTAPTYFLKSSLIDPRMRAFNEGLRRPRVARTQKIIRLHPLLCSVSMRTSGLPPVPYYRMVGSKLTFAFMELEIRQFASAFSISSLALAASAFAESVMVGFNVMAVN